MNLAIKAMSTNTILVCISIILMILALLQKNSNFLDVRSVFLSHFKVFIKSPLQCIVIFGVPALLTIVAVDKQNLSKEIVDVLNIVLSILISMFFAMLSILSALPPKNLNKNQENDTVAKNRNIQYNLLLIETFNSIMFECILCILVLATSVILLFFNDFSASWQLVVISTVVYYLSLVIVFNIFVIIKRIKVLFDNR